MLKRALRIVATFGVLTASYLGYCRGFAEVQAWVGSIQRIPVIPRDPNPSRTARETAELARSAFGADHWTADPKQATWYYDASRGYWMFFKTYDRTHNERRLEFSPFALIWRSRGKSNLNTVLADKAWVDFDKPFDLAKPGAEAAKVTHAVIEGRVRIRDDKGTPSAQLDDTTIAMTHLEFDDAEQEVRTDSPVELREGDLVARCLGMKITLRPKPPAADGEAAGFAGAETIWLLKEIAINVADVGSTGIVPGASAAKSSEPRPGELICDGPARIDLPAPRPKPAPGSDPDPVANEPVIAQFFRNVVLRQGGPEQPDQCNADTLRLTLVPTEREATAIAEVETDLESGELAKAESELVAAETAGGPLTSLVLQAAEASGHAVWLQSPSQGLKARGNELRYKRLAPEQPDLIYFRGDSETWVEQVAMSEDGSKVDAVHTMRTKDVTIYQGLKEGEPPTFVARGPGTMDSRPERGATIAQAAEWNDRLEMQTVTTAVGLRRRVTLTGTPKLVSPTQGTLTAQDKIIAYLKIQEQASRSANATDPSLPPQDAPGLTPSPGGPLPIDWFEATGDVRLSAVPADPAKPDSPPPGAREIVARKRLNVVFAESDNEDIVATPPQADSRTPEPNAAPPPAVLAAADPLSDSMHSEPEAVSDPPKPPAPAMHVEADDVWAKVAMGGANSQAELREARLRRNVIVHQDPEAGKERGLDATAHAVDLQVRGEGKAWVEAHGDVENGVDARIITDTFEIEGPKLGVDQSSDYAWVRGPGRLTQEEREAAPNPVQPDMAQGDSAIVPTSYLQEPVLARRPGASGVTAGSAPTPEDPRRRLLRAGRGKLTISWTDQMEFYGQPPEAPDYAYARFLGDVHAVTDEASVTCQRMTAVLDGPVSFRKAITVPGVEGSAGAAADPDDELADRAKRVASVYCVDDVELITRKYNPETGQLDQKGRIIGPKLQYNLVNGRFLVDGAGTSWLYKTPEKNEESAGGPLDQPNRSNPAQAPKPPDPRQAAGEASTTRTSAASADRGANPATIRTTARPAADGKIQSRRPKISGPMELTRITFQKRVEGRFLAEDESDNPNTPMLATFLGGVQVLNAKVRDENADASPDNPPPDFFFVSGDKVDVVREAVIRGASSEDDQDQFFIDVLGTRPVARNPQWSIAANRITYDSLKQLVYAYGDQNGVLYGHQDRPGQPISGSTSRAMMFNRLTQQVQWIDPKNVLLIDPRSGIRAVPGPSAAPGSGSKPKPRSNLVEHGLPRTQSGDIERRGYNGR